MRSSYIIILSAMIFSSTLLNAQNKNTKKADKFFTRFEYSAAIKEYNKLVDKNKADAYVYKQLADSYYHIFNSSEASKWYKEVIKTNQEGETYFRYAQMLKGQGKYEEANKQMQVFASKMANDPRAIAFKAEPNYLPRLQDKKKLYDINLLDMNSDKSDFGAILYKDGVYFASARNGARKTFKWTNEPYLDIYRANYNVDGTITNPEEVKALNTRWHDGPVVFTQDGNTAYFVSETFNQKKGFEKDKESNSKFGQVSLYSAKMENGQWSNITPLPFTSNAYSTSNPSLSTDGKTLYFSSNMPGGAGGNDVWKVTINADGSFGKPENMGSKVNTASDESFPFISQDNNTLYFASNGHAGFGGYDVFMIDLKASTSAINLGKPINSEKDDFAFTFDVQKNIGFVSSNRSGVDNIYKAIPVCGVEVQTRILDAKTGAPIAGANVSIVDDKKNVIATERSNNNGEVAYYVECNKGYTVQASMKDYESNSATVEASKGDMRKVTVALDPIEVIIVEDKIILNEIVFEFNKHNITEQGAKELDRLVGVMQKYPAMVIMVKSHTDNRGDDKFNMALSNRRAKSTIDYVISKGIDKARISGKGYGESEPKVDCKEECSEEQHAENRRSEFIIIKK